MKNIFKKIYLFILILFSGLNSYAQLYPVQLTPIFNSPYSVKISDYATSMDTKMRLLINPIDISINNRQVRLKLYIQGNGLNIQTSDYIQQRPIFINGGELQTLTNTDISTLFRLENLQGITAAQYANGLPEGMYNFCFEMYDYITNQKISQKSCASLYLVLNNPPLLNTPQKNEQIAASDFPNIMFTWTPRQNNATNVSYKFELKQLIDPTLDPQFAFQMAPLLYEETLFSTALLYNLGMPILTPGMRYAWRVRAISTTGLSENAVFKNDGYSEIYSFKYTAPCAAPTFLLSEAQGLNSVKITWQGIPDHTKYQLQYKKQDVRNAQWFSTNSLNTQSLITNLEPGVTYQFRVGSSCDLAADGVQSFTYSNSSTFTTPTETNGVPTYNCGIIPKINIQNQKPLTNLIQSETFTAGDFPVTILELKGENSPYSGRGYIIVPYLADTKIAVEFNNIVVNTDYQLISGVVETSYNPDWKNVVNVEDFTGEGQSGKIKEEISFEIDKIVINANGDIIVNGKGDEQVTIPGGKDTVITDSTGKIYYVDKDGNGSDEGIVAAVGGKSTPENTDGVDKNGQATAFTAQGITIAFSANNSKYAFDVLPDNATSTLQKLYKQAGKNFLPYKAVLNGDTDTVLAAVTTTDSEINLDDIVFKTESGAKVDAVRNDKIFILTVRGSLNYAEEQILATIQQGDKWKVIGAFVLVHISPKEVNVALVPTDDISQSKLDEVITNTQKIYNKVGVKINFTKEPVLNIDSVVSGNSIQTEKNTITSTYSTEQQKINNLYQSTESSYILFITNKTSSTGQQGYMRLNGQFGYVFNSETALSKTPAHELGHGIFKLEHPFEVYKTAEKSTDLLMDYSSGTVLNHQDWKQINDPAFRLYAFQSQSSGNLIAGHDLIVIKKYKESNGKIKEDIEETKEMSLTKYNQYKKTLWDTFQLCNKKGFSEWIEGYSQYTLGNDCSFKNGFYGIHTGVLVIEITEKTPVYNISYYKTKTQYEASKNNKNVLVFVNGYRDSGVTKFEFDDSDNMISNISIDDYWEGIDLMFEERLKDREVYYADGHHSVKTSNHRSTASFANNMFNHKMATSPNIEGFTLRKNNGLIAGINLSKELEKIKFNKKTEKIDIVAHSMGYAYALGIINKLKANGYMFGEFYIIAPENACSGGSNWKDFEGVWQYGSNLGEPDADPIGEQDGIAPQCAATGLTKDQRAFIPKDWKPKGFLDSHSINNYTWIFTKLINPNKDKGYVKKR
ncbi:hypothetical protein DBB36_08545 [Flavobacterium sp. WLB]|uniref:fibronectin type III domain-containing protein n=1 Tax=unclassified Flavobacterium TaxID=196869 RepID=UPI0006ABC2F0|nr:MULTISPECIES: fibronectin type III domain-containing protein [unclassified Flavobacterium]KOP36639.1 hypothetical protein AKO67_19695 [Flavobacterium sp. VMW]OWU91939.1 hypothetical protein APR43_04795 [Flavobacterium sp. NLM]PUU70405.1 hypothetical protein DBB36_08545 [Flavobacterium sp. WLB]